MPIINVLSGMWCIIPDKLMDMHAIYDAHLKGQKLDTSSFESNDEKPDNYEIIDNVAIIHIDGVIAKKMNMFTKISGGVSTQQVGDNIVNALNDDAVCGIVLHIDSPGGTVDGTQELANIIFAGRCKKPILSYSDGQVASAAYWIGSAAHEMYISGDTNIVGSIGVIQAHTDYSGKEKKEGIKTTEIYAGKYKRIASQHEPLTAEGNEYLQGQTDYLYTIFVDQVAKHRGVSADIVIKDMADGRIFIGQQAVQRGLVDGILGFSEVISRIKILYYQNIEDSELTILNNKFKNN